MITLSVNRRETCCSERQPGRVPQSIRLLCDRHHRHHPGLRRRRSRDDCQRFCVRLASTQCLCWCALTRRPGPTRIFTPKALRGECARRGPPEDFGILCASGSRARPRRGGSGRPVCDRTRHGTPVLHGALAYLECRLALSAQDAGDHTIFIAEVEEVVVREGKPLLFFGSQYRKMGEGV